MSAGILTIFLTFVLFATAGAIAGIVKLIEGPEMRRCVFCDHMKKKSEMNYGVGRHTYDRYYFCRPCGDKNGFDSEIGCQSHRSNYLMDFV